MSLPKSYEKTKRKESYGIQETEAQASERGKGNVWMKEVDFQDS
jgi:hypothetical protein